MKTSGIRILLGLGLVLVGAVVMAVSTFLPLTQPAGAILFVRSNSLIQHGGWQLILLAVGIAVSAVGAIRPNAQNWMWIPPVAGSVLAIVWIVMAANMDSIRVLYPLGPDGYADPTKPGVEAPLDIAIYVACTGAAVSLLGSLILKFGDELGGQSATSAGPPVRVSKKCPDCAETILADAKICKHCGYRFPTSKVKCNNCQHVQEVLKSAQSFQCSECGQLLRRKVTT